MTDVNTQGTPAPAGAPTAAAALLGDGPPGSGRASWNPTPAVETAPDGAATGGDAAAPVVTTPSPSGFNVAHKQLIEAVAFEVDQGRLTEEQAAEMLAADGVDLGTLPGDDENAMADHLRGLGPGFESAGSPADYQLPKFADDNADAGEVAAFDAQAREWLYESYMPPAIATSLAEEAVRVTERFEGMDDAGRALWQADQQRQLQALWKGEEYQQKIGLARQLVKDVDKLCGGTLVPWLEESGAGNSAWVIMQLAEQAHRINLGIKRN